MQGTRPSQQARSPGQTPAAGARAPTAARPPKGGERPANDMTVKRRERVGGGKDQEKRDWGVCPSEGEEGRIESIGRILKIDLSQFDKKEEEGHGVV